ncbi:MAG: serine hydrolase domain-containing protein [Bacteroidota bacterium]|nr:serine hydrolase domain-containing protein [Bacteroidota bacterium]|tara:strand:- start:45 stop:1271 length:1227 start_codon:yes stop_codon:yes gene_type:complete
MRKLSLLLIFIVFGCNTTDPITDYQLSLISEEITGSNIFKVVKNGEVIYNKILNSGKLGDKDISEETIFPIWSMSKPVTTVAMMILYDRDMYKLDDKLSKYLPEYENVTCKGEEGVYPCNNKIKVIDLLTHRSGYTYYSDVYGENKFISQPSPLNKFTSSYYFDNLDDFSKAVANHPLEFEPGSHYLYGLNQAILGRLIEVLSGMSFYDFLKENLFDPMEMNDTKFYLTQEERPRVQPLFINRLPNTPFNPSETSLKGFTYLLDEQTYDINNSAHFGGEGLVSTFSDYSNFCEMLVNKGIYKGEKIISESSYNLMIDKYTNTAPDPNEPFVFPELAGHYFGFTFSVMENPILDGTGSPKGVFGWSGYHNTHFWIDPQNKLYGLFMSRSREFNFGIQHGLKKAVYSTVN